jgi:hypothetical protein
MMFQPLTECFSNLGFGLFVSILCFVAKQKKNVFFCIFTTRKSGIAVSSALCRALKSAEHSKGARCRVPTS